MGIRTELHDHVDAALSDDPRLALAAVRRLTEEEVPWLELRTVHLARRHGYSWARIARLLQRSRQAVQRRYAADEATWVTPPRRPLGPADVLDGVMVEARRLAEHDREREQLDRDDVDVVPW